MRSNVAHGDLATASTTEPVTPARAESTRAPSSDDGAAQNLFERFSPSGASRKEVEQLLDANDGHAGRAAAALRSRYQSAGAGGSPAPVALRQQVTELNPLHGTPGTPAYDDALYLVPEPEPEPEEGDEDEQSGLMGHQRSDVSFDTAVDTSIIYDLEAILPAPAVAPRPSRAKRCWRSATQWRWYGVRTQLVLYVLGFALVQSGLWSASSDTGLVWAIPGWICFLGWLAAYRRALQDEAQRSEQPSVDSVARENRLDAGQLRSLAESMGVNGETEGFLLGLVADAMKAPLPFNWTEAQGISGPYFYNTITRQRTTGDPRHTHAKILILAERRKHSGGGAYLLALEPAGPEPEPEPEPEDRRALLCVTK